MVVWDGKRFMCSFLSFLFPQIALAIGVLIYFKFKAGGGSRNFWVCGCHWSYLITDVAGRCWAECR